MASNDISLKEMRESIKALTEQTREIALQLRNIDKHLATLNEKWVEGLTVISERMG
jgi:uncharacterized protein YukE